MASISKFVSEISAGSGLARTNRQSSNELGMKFIVINSLNTISLKNPY